MPPPECIMAGPLTRHARDGPEGLPWVETKLVKCPEALSAYQHIKAEAVLQIRGYNLLGRTASDGKQKRRSQSSDL
jgi:hypothetical protein